MTVMLCAVYIGLHCAWLSVTQLKITLYCNMYVVCGIYTIAYTYMYYLTLFIVCLQTNKHGFIKIYCIGGAGHPARIEVFDSKKTASKGKPILYQIPFRNVKNIVTIEVQKKPRTAITVQGEDTFIFSSSDTNNDMELLGYCKLLRVLPNYVVPEIPKRCLVSQQHIEQCCDCSKYDAGV